MPRANRYYTPGNIWHITHRCHNKDFLLKFKKDRVRWMKWLFEAKKRFGLTILNYNVTCNHIHLMLLDNNSQGSISKFMQLVQARLAQEYNFRKKRKGAFWEDRYHATAIGSDEHMLHCMTYINLNMVRAGVVDHPVKWEESGFFELMHPKKRFALIDYEYLWNLLNAKSLDQLRGVLTAQILEALNKKDFKREGKWTECLAVGDEVFVKKIKQQLDMKAKTRKLMKTGEREFILSESEFSYTHHFEL